MTPVPVTLATAAAAVFVNLWLGWRVITARRDAGVRLGDGGNEAVLRRMRAQANFIENAPFFLILLGGLELSGAMRWRCLRSCLCSRASPMASEWMEAQLPAGVWPA